MNDLSVLQRKHTATQGLQAVHSIMLENIQEDKNAEKAKEMESYLRYFKKVFFNPKDYQSDNKIIQALGLDEEAILYMKKRFQQVLGVTEKYNQIFQSKHAWYKDRKDFDDIVEGELNALLQVIAEEAFGRNQEINLGQRIVGGEQATIDIDDLGEIAVDKLINNISEKINKVQNTPLIEDIESVSSKSGKTDNRGYQSTLIVSANMSKKFEDFIKLFSDVSFSVKNYQGSSSWDIHLGSTIPIKAMYASLRGLGINKEESVHVYSHSVASYNKNPNMIKRNNDIFHLRFMYELTGMGLIDAQTKQPLNAVDFLIYNDPDSENIYVRSTQALINEILSDKENQITNPWKGIYLSKLKFN